MPVCLCGVRLDYLVQITIGVTIALSGLDGQVPAHFELWDKYSVAVKACSSVR